MIFSIVLSVTRVIAIVSVVDNVSNWRDQCTITEVLVFLRSPRRQLKDVQDDYNRKGLISDQGAKKKAFYVMRDWYQSKK